MKIKTTSWPPTKRELAWLLLNYTYPQIAEMFDTHHATVQRLRDKYRIQVLSRKDRNKLLTRTDFTKWSYTADLSSIPSSVKAGKYKKVRASYGRKTYFTSGNRALCTEVIGEIIPKFIDCHHECHNPRCLNPRHVVLTIQQAHIALHKGQIKQLPNELVLRIADYYSDGGDRCIEDDLPKVKTVKLPKGRWDEFLVDSMLVVDHLERQIAVEQAKKLLGKAKLAA